MEETIKDKTEFNNVKVVVNSLLEKSFIPTSSSPSVINDVKESDSLIFNSLLLLDQLLSNQIKDYLDLTEISVLYQHWKKVELDKFGVPSLLIVEDEPEYNDMFYDLLSKDFNVYSVFDGESCKDILKTETFDIILLDLFLPDISGSELVSHFLKHNQNSKIIVITAFDITREVIDVMRAGASDLLHKPVLKDDLFKSIDSAWLETTHKHVVLTSEFDFFRKQLNDDQKVLLLKALFLYYQSKNKELRMFDIYLFYPELRKINYQDNKNPTFNKQEIIANYIAGMTDRFAIKQFNLYC